MNLNVTGIETIAITDPNGLCTIAGIPSNQIVPAPSPYVPSSTIPGLAPTTKWEKKYGKWGVGLRTGGP